MGISFPNIPHIRGPPHFHLAAFLSAFLLRTLLPFAHNSPLLTCPALTPLTLPPSYFRQGDIVHSSPHLLSTSITFKNPRGMEPRQV